uniref:Sm domain-containing protein n=1 Tax=Globisporangium ultimum (strain ATCC 200006 / CBS 805.95 / DAOM BR144) TaxID=431595 RepID=K3X891_GLOUD
MVDPVLMEARLRAYYATHNPDNKQNIAEIVRRYAGREQELCAKLKKKYGIAPDLSGGPSPAAGDAVTAEKQKPAESSAAVKYDPAFVPYAIPPSAGGALDFRAPEFDPVQALRMQKQLPSLPQAHPLDNIQKCRYLLPESDPHYQKVVVHAKKSSAEKSASNTERVVKKEPTPTLFDRLADTYMEGPFVMLRRCFLERKRIVVVVRRVNSIRGTCVGFLKAFDKHMNIVLMDVTETCISHDTHAKMLRDVRDGKLQAESTLFSVADPRRNRRFTHQQYAKQLFVRGDNVVMVMEDSRWRRVE